MKCRLGGMGERDEVGYSLTPAISSRIPFLAACLLIFVVVSSCGSSRKISRLREERMSASISLPEEAGSYVPKLDSGKVSNHGDTLKVTDLDGKEVLIMRAIKDDATGEMVATEQIDAAMVTARFRNVAERNGRVNLEFQVIVPERMQDSRWQLRFHPDLFVMADSLRLDDVVITGASYRKAQMRGYQLYDRFLKRIITDTLRLVDMRNLEIFLERNIPQLYAFKNDTSYVFEGQFSSVFGVTEQRAIEHYTWRFLVRRNERLEGLKDKKWKRYVKVPLTTDGIRLDTVMRGEGGEMVYNYVQTINMRPRLRKVDVLLSGEIFEQERQIYTVPRTAPLTFYISSVSSFADETDRYLTKIVSRNVEANTTCNIDFNLGSADIDEGLNQNGREIAYIKSTLRSLLTNESFELDSTIIIASASPEGSFKSNARLTYNRAASASEYFSGYVDHIKDSLRREEGFFINVGEDLTESGVVLPPGKGRDVRFLSRSGGENWGMLDVLVETDSLLSVSDKERYAALSDISEPDERERAMRSLTFYEDVRERLYPKLRTVVFNFHLHRVGMVRDTIHTTVLDSSYMAGVQALKDHDYEEAASILGPYQDFNAAVAYVALDRNKSAMSILERCPPSAKVNYMMAIIHSREGRDREAVECYVRSCSQDPSFVHRGNLDPEIAVLISRYNLNTREDKEEY